MDSGSSLQSSSGGDDDFDSRNESISSFLNPSSTTHFNPNPGPNPILQLPPPSSSDHHQPPPPAPAPADTHFFDPFSNPNPNSVYNMDPVWARNIRPDPNFSDFGANQTEAFLSSEQGGLASQAPVENSNLGHGSDHRQVMKNPKKRTRASRRAPTTVLTTDTTNFRQMVQEFTGIPAAPFSASSSSSFSRRLDLFGGGGGGGVGQMFPLRPSAQKFRQHIPNTTDVNNFQLSPLDILGFQKQPQSLLSQNPVFSFQSLLQTKPPEQVNVPVSGASKPDNQQAEFFPSSSTRWRGQDENLVSFEGGNGNNQNVEGYKLNSSENVVSSRSEGNVDSWVCPSD